MSRPASTAPIRLKWQQGRLVQRASETRCNVCWLYPDGRWKTRLRVRSRCGLRDCRSFWGAAWSKTSDGTVITSLRFGHGVSLGKAC